ncbi:MAG TPA: heme exporter protein CcmB [Verrucomicrobiae bacterium]|nr:heme exporter protein CcmB [Verrucomicrobiae bacterium]
MSAVGAVIARELKLALRRRSEWAQPLVFYAVVATLFALGAAPSAPWLKVAAPSILWVGALLAALLSLDRVFRGDREDGTLEQMFLSSQAVSLLVGGKLFAQWLVIGLPLTLLAPLLALGLGMEAQVIGVLLLSLLLGLPTLVLTAGFCSALIVGLPRSGVLLPVLVLPLVAPSVIFGAGAVRAAQSGLPADAPLYFLGAILVLCACGVPLAAAVALKNALD